MMTGTKFDIKKFDENNDFGLWHVRMKALLEQQGLAATLEELPAATIVAYNNVIQKKAYNALILCLGDRVLQEITKDTTASGIWKKLETFYMTKSLANRLYLKKKLYTFHMHPEVLATLNSRELQKMTEEKGDGGEGLYVRGRFGQRDVEHGTDSAWSKSQERSSRLGNEDHVSGSRADGYDSVDVMMAMSVEELLDWIIDFGGSYHITYRRDYLVDFEKYDGGNILLGDDRECRVRGTKLRRNLISLDTLEKEGFTVKMQSGKIKVIKGSLVVLSGTRRANCVYTLDNQAVTRKTLKGRKRLEEYQTSWKIKKGIQQQNGLVEETNVTLLAKVHCFLIQSGLSKVFWAEDTTMSTYLVNRSPSSAIGFKTLIDMLGFFGWLASIKQGMLGPVKVKCIFMGYRKGFNKSGEYKKTLIGFGVVGSHETQTQDLIEYHLARDREQHSARELFGYREDNNEVAFVVVAVYKICAYESLTFNDIVAYEVISKWKAGLKENMDARLDAEIWVTKGLMDKAKRNILGMKIVKDHSDNTLRVSHSRFYNEKLVQTLLEGHSILSLEGSLLGDYDMEKNGKWSCIYAVESLQVYHRVYTRPDIASADVGMLDGFDRGL
ncbi:zinc finger, CCHC-type containing protein [Tanacetum coccineum]